MTTRQRIAAIGECMVELQRHGEGLTYRFGGDTLNTSVYMARILDPMQFDVTYVTGLGNDPFSEEMLAGWQAEGINTSLVQRVPNKLPGLYFITTDAGGERSFFYWRNDAAARFWPALAGADAVLAEVSRADMIYISGISMAILPPESRKKVIEVLAACRAHGGKVAFDNNYRPRQWESPEVAAGVYDEVLKHTHTALFTLDDEVAMRGPTEINVLIERLQGLGVEEIVIKQGEGPCVVETGGQRVEVDATKVDNVVDTTAAGDSFGAAYLAARLSGADLESAARAGHALAGKVIQHKGAVIPREFM